MRPMVGRGVVNKASCQERPPAAPGAAGANFLWRADRNQRRPRNSIQGRPVGAGVAGTVIDDAEGQCGRLAEDVAKILMEPLELELSFRSSSDPRQGLLALFAVQSAGVTN